MSNNEKQRFKLSLDKKVIDYIEDIKEEHNIGFNGDAISFLVADHQRLKNEQSSLNNIKEELKQIRLRTNNTDRNTQTLIEMVNGSKINDSVNNILTKKRCSRNCEKVDIMAKEKSISRQEYLKTIIEKFADKKCNTKKK